MNRFSIYLAALVMGTASSVAMAFSPAQLVAENRTNFQSKAFINGHQAGHPTEKNSTQTVAWQLVRAICKNVNPCVATIEMATDTPSPIVIGEVKLNLDTGDITLPPPHPKFSIVVAGPGHFIMLQK